MNRIGSARRTTRRIRGRMAGLAGDAAAILALAATGVAAAGDDPVACRTAPSRHDDGRLKSCVTAAAATLGEQSVPAGSAVWFGTDGRLARVRLAEAAPVFGLVLPAGTELFYGRDGRLRHFWLPADTELQGHLVRGQDDGAGNQLHPNGRLRAIWLAEDAVIDGVPCSSAHSVWRFGFGVLRLGTQRMAWFHDNGRLRQAMVARDVVLDGQAFRAGEVVSLTRDGRVDLQAEKLSAW